MHYGLCKYFEHDFLHLHSVTFGWIKLLVALESNTILLTLAIFDLRKFFSKKLWFYTDYTVFSSRLHFLPTTATSQDRHSWLFYMCLELCRNSTSQNKKIRFQILFLQLILPLSWQDPKPQSRDHNHETDSCTKIENWLRLNVYITSKTGRRFKSAYEQ